MRPWKVVRYEMQRIFTNNQLMSTTAGLTMEHVAGSNTSVFAGTFFRDYSEAQTRDGETLPRLFLLGVDLLSTSWSCSSSDTGATKIIQSCSFRYTTSGIFSLSDPISHSFETPFLRAPGQTVCIDSTYKPRVGTCPTFWPLSVTSEFSLAAVLTRNPRLLSSPMRHGMFTGKFPKIE